METENNRRADGKRRRTEKNTQERPQQEIQYTQPKPFFRKRLVMQMLTVAAVVLAVAVGVSVFFKVDTVMVTGASKYSALTVAEASGVEVGDSLLFFGRGGAASRIQSALPYVGSVRFDVKLPGTVNIIIEEKPVAYAVEATDGSWWMITSDGKVVERIDAREETDPTITGVLLEEPMVGKKAVAAEEAEETVTTTQAERLQTAVSILRQLERWELFQQVSDIDVSDLFGLRLSCTGNYRVELGDGEDLNKKIGMVKSTLTELTNYGGGVLKLFYQDDQWQIQCYPWS